MQTNVGTKTLLTMLKYLGWTGLGAVITALLNMIPSFNLPGYVAVFIGGLFKTLATYVETNRQNSAWR